MTTRAPRNSRGRSQTRSAFLQEAVLRQNLVRPPKRLIFGLIPPSSRLVITLLRRLLRLLPFIVGGHRQLGLENLALRQQLAVYQRAMPRPPLLGERHLRCILTRYLAHYHQARTHLALDKDAPDRRRIELPVTGKIVRLPEVGGLHHRYLREAA